MVLNEKVSGWNRFDLFMKRFQNKHQIDHKTFFEKTVVLLKF